jgi:ATP-dependent Clp protease adapter protein ClpS
MPEVTEQPKVVDDKLTERLKELKFEPMWQVILYNDEHHSELEVFKDLQQIFGHTETIAVKIIQEISLNAKGICEVEPKESAQLHVELLKSAHYTATTEPIC